MLFDNDVHYFNYISRSNELQCYIKKVQFLLSKETDIKFFSNKISCSV